MRKTWIILAFLVVLALVNSVSAYGPITFSQGGNIVVTYISTSADYHNDFGVWLPAPQLFLDRNNEATIGEVFPTGKQCVPNEEVVLYISTPQGHTYLSNVAGEDNLNHALVEGPQVDGSFKVSFENQYGTQPASDRDFNDVVLSVACIPTTNAPEFPTLALPAGLIVGLLGAVLFIRKDME